VRQFTVPKPYANTQQWVQGFTVMAANPITAPNVGTFDAAGVFTPVSFVIGDYVPGIGTPPRPYRVSTAVDVPVPLQQIINSTNPMPTVHCPAVTPIRPIFRR
jgi:hypothetical protein